MTTRTIASLGSTRLGSGRSPGSIRRASWKMAARMTPSVPAIERSKGPRERGTDRAPLAGRLLGSVNRVDPADDIAEFLTSRRAKVTPEQVGLPAYGPRRVKGLRREEVASLAGVSVEYYNRLERGNAAGVSDSVLDALAGRCAWTTPSARTSTTSRAPRALWRRDAGARRSSASGRSSSGSSTR